MAQLPRGEIAPQDGSLPQQTTVGVAERTFHAYIHVPFCRVRCGYCDFNTYTAQEIGSASQKSFANDLSAEIAFSEKVLLDSGIPHRKLSTIFFGGGTPTLLPAEDLIGMLGKLKSSFGLAEGIEITTEANPDSVDEEYFQKLSGAGFTRISIGMQSAVPKVLSVLERSHKPENVLKAVGAAKLADLQTSVDLIYGSPGETLEDWKHSVEEAISYETDHISAYSLIVEDGTKLARQIRAGEIAPPDEDLHAEMYEVAEELLTAAGFSNYEVSNWSKAPQTRSAHNLAYWKSMDWWGFGPGAHSHIGGVRWWNVKNPAAYTERVSAGNSPALEREILDEENRDLERVMLEARISDGMDLAWLKTKGFAEPMVIAELIADELVDNQAIFSGKLRLTLKGRLLADYVMRKLVG